MGKEGPTNGSMVSEEVEGNGIQGSERRISFNRKRYTSSTAGKRNESGVCTDRVKCVGVIVRN